MARRSSKMKPNKSMLAALGLGAAFLMRNEKSRNEIMKQFKQLSSSKKSS